MGLDEDHLEKNFEYEMEPHSESDFDHELYDDDWVVNAGHKSVTLSDFLALPIIRFYGLLVIVTFGCRALLVTGTFAIRDRCLRYYSLIF